jgi:hypothetical protein
MYSLSFPFLRHSASSASSYSDPHNMRPVAERVNTFARISKIISITKERSLEQLWV